MPTAQTPANPALPLDPDTAYGIVYQRVYAPRLFEKVAAATGFKPRNEAEAQEMLTMAAQLRAAHDEHLEKQAAATGSFLNQAHNHLNGELVKRGFAVPAGQPDVAVKQASDLGARDPELAAAILSLHVASQGQSAA